MMLAWKRCGELVDICAVLWAWWLCLYCYHLLLKRLYQLLLLLLPPHVMASPAPIMEVTLDNHHGKFDIQMLHHNMEKRYDNSVNNVYMVVPFRWHVVNI